MDMIDGDGRMCGSAWRWVLGWGAALLMVAGVGAGCDKGSETASPGAEAPVRTDRYEGVAATVTKLPTEAASLMLAHEDMPAFKNAAGEGYTATAAGATATGTSYSKYYTVAVAVKLKR